MPPLEIRPERREFFTEYWSEWPFLSPRNLPDPGIELESPALAGGFFTTEPSGKLIMEVVLQYMKLEICGVENTGDMNLGIV